MEKRIGVCAILITNRKNIPQLNNVFHEYSNIIIGRQGLPLADYNINVISLILKGTSDQISALAGKIGKLDGIQAKTVLTKYKEIDNVIKGSNT